ncbi:MAG TPA: universal stress protein, partial [Rudaea sp.]
RAEKLGVRCDAVVAHDDQPWKAILATARVKHCSLVAMASHGYSGIAAKLLGSQTQKVLTNGTKPVLVFR